MKSPFNHHFVSRHPTGFDHLNFKAHQTIMFFGAGYALLVGGLVAMFYFPINIGFLIIPIDELIFFRGVAQPPTSQSISIKAHHFFSRWSPPVLEVMAQALAQRHGYVLPKEEPLAAGGFHMAGGTGWQTHFSGLKSDLYGNFMGFHMISWFRIINHIESLNSCRVSPSEWHRTLLMTRVGGLSHQRGPKWGCPPNPQSHDLVLKLIVSVIPYFKKQTLCVCVS